MPKPVTQGKSELFVPAALSDAQREQYDELGYLNLGRTLTDQGLARMREEVMAAWQAEKESFDASRTWLQNALLTDIHRRSDVVRRYYFSGPMVDVAEQLIGANIKGASSQLTFKMRGNTQAFAWHQDNAYGELDPPNAISCLTAMDDVDVENGCLWLIPGSYKFGQAERTHTLEDKAAQRPVELDVDDTHRVPMPMRAGECLFFHSHMLHMSEANRSADRDRRILFLRYADADAVEVYNDNRPRLGRLLRGRTRFTEVEGYEADLPSD